MPFAHKLLFPTEYTVRTNADAAQIHAQSGGMSFYRQGVQWWYSLFFLLYHIMMLCLGSATLGVRLWLQQYAPYLCRLHVWRQSGRREGFDRRMKITRFTYNPEAATIGDPLDLISGLFGSVDHRPHDVRSGQPHDLCDHRLDRPCAGHQRRTDRRPMELWLADRVQVWGLQGSRKSTSPIT